MTAIVRRVVVLVALIASSLAIAAPAGAAPVRPGAGWVVTASSGSTPIPANAAPQTNSDPPGSATAASTALASTPQDELKQICRNQHSAEASTLQGWMTDRFDRCYIGHRLVELRCAGCTTIIASVEFDYTLVGIAQNGTRQVDFTLTFDNWKALGGEERVTTPMRVSVSGCGGFVSCDPDLGELTRPLGEWQADPQLQVTMTSANNTGIGSDYVARTPVSLGMAITPASPDIQPWVENTMTQGEVRFDSAGAAAGKFNGTVFSDFIPTYDLVALATMDANLLAVTESARHIDDALHHVERTFPSFVGKSPPGEYIAALGANQRPLHRLIDSALVTLNRSYAGKVCADVWGDGAATPNLNCDEYPFASTVEGAYTGSTAATGNVNGWQNWNGSARMIGEVDNQDSGRLYLNIGFYQTQRILDSDPFFVA